MCFFGIAENAFIPNVSHIFLDQRIVAISQFQIQQKL